MKKRTKSLQFDARTRHRVFVRDGGRCIFCDAGFEGGDGFERGIKDVMHFIPKSQGGLGIEQNGAIGCRFHHMKLDNGNDTTLRARMLEHFEKYLRQQYKEKWDRKELTFSKWENESIRP